VSATVRLSSNSMPARVQRLTPPQVDPHLEIRVSEAAESITALAMVTGSDDAKFDIGTDWFHEIRTRLTGDLARVIALLQGHEPIHALWHTLLGVLADAPDSLPAFIEHLEAMPPDELWLQLLGYHAQPDPSPELRDAMLAAGRGLVEPLERWFERDPARRGAWVHGLAGALGGDAEGSRRLVLDVLRRWHDQVFAARWPDIEPILKRDAAEKRRFARDHSPAEVVEEATNGGEYEPEAGVGRIVLLPDYVGRPWMRLSRQRDALVIVHPVAAEALADSAEEVRRQRVLRLTRALSDDTRLRALRLLAGSSLTLQELADELGVRKSTMHHHVAVLRSAGLLRLRFGEKRYSLRTAPLGDLPGLLGDYLGEGRRRP
jgi:DNA-binding transcriptional ArsR family regulator